MKDDRGLYYYPDPATVISRVYVRRGEGGVEFRLWHAEHPDVWTRHEWLAYDVIKAAAALYKERGTGSDPLSLYDIHVAEALLKDEARKR